ncbi:hypothetical protein [Levilactobacillus cerevisiae]|uniref:hypothetical protein n=1 Tax=Levilactobacillus cerevisiae TaxID=1704076 RepID=UPI000F76D0B9|nr:hypothetical protein [Levilactobacillus cerevisiae]
MQYIKHLIIVGVAMMAWGGLTSLTSANAATWYQGTPKALRGLYQSTAPQNNSAAGFPPVIEITAKTFSLGVSNNPEQLVKRVKYRKSHGVYYLKGHVEHRGWVKARNVRFGLKKKNHTLVFVHTKQFLYEPGEKFKRTTHVTSY